VVAKYSFLFFFAAFRPRARLVAENLALRQQLAALVRGRHRARLGPIDRAFWVVLSCTWSRWAEVLAIVKPAPVIEWHRRGQARKSDRFVPHSGMRRGRSRLWQGASALSLR
jgi:hypothetical protein